MVETPHTLAPELARLAREHGFRIAERARWSDGVWRIGGEAELSYPDGGHSACAAVEDASFWFRHRSAVLLDVLRRHGAPPALWEIGAGNGAVARSFGAAGLEVVAVEPGPIGARNAADRGVPTIQGTLESLALPDACLPALGAYDVLEHLDDPRPLLAEMRRVVRPGGVVQVSVPALGWLWSQHDEVAGHFRRYDRARLDRLLEGAGLSRVTSGYFMASLVAPVLFGRVLARWRPPDEVLAETAQHNAASRAGLAVRALEAALRAERAWDARRRLPLGTSLYGLYRA